GGSRIETHLGSRYPNPGVRGALYFHHARSWRTGASAPKDARPCARQLGWLLLVSWYRQPSYSSVQMLPCRVQTKRRAGTPLPTGSGGLCLGGRGAGGGGCV